MEKDKKIAIGFRLIGSDGCEYCKSLMKSLDGYGMSYTFIDADADNQQDYCDKFDIDELPVLQAYNIVTNSVFFSKVGQVNAMAFFKEAVEVGSRKYGLENRYSEPFKADGLRTNPYGLIKKLKNKNDCKGCKKRK